MQALLNKSATGAGAGTSGGATQEAMTKQKEVFYSPAVPNLIEIRQHISTISFQNAHERLLKAKELIVDEQLQAENSQQVFDLYTHSKDLTLNLSQFGDDRPLSSVRYSGDGQYLISSSLTNAVKVWDGSGLAPQGSLVGHTERVTGVAQSSALLFSAHRYVFASSSADGTCCIWNGSGLLDEAMGMEVDGSAPAGHLLHRLPDHQNVVSAVEFHPQLPLLASACHDFSWRLWDVNTGEQLQLQDGHVRECCALAFHPDGSLLYTADAGGVGLLWDLRSGQMVQGFQGHSKKISEVSINANGFQVATSSLDNTVKVWDLRKRKIFYTLPAHANIISGVRYSASGELLVTSSFDGTLKVWSSRNFEILRTLAGHTGKVMGCDIAPDERHIISAGYDRTIKLWAHKDEF